MRWLSLLLLLFMAGIMFKAAAQEPAAPPTLDLKERDQAGIFTFYDAPALASLTGKPLAIGDFDANGCGDLAVTGHYATHEIEGETRTIAGHVRVIMNQCDLSGELEAGNATAGTNFFTLYGAHSNDFFGTQVEIADFNGDGYDDLLIGAQNSGGEAQAVQEAGAAYLLFGSAEMGSHADVDTRTLPEDMLVIYGAEEHDRLGIWVSSGDFDGDGLDDVLVSAPEADGEENRRRDTGEVWIIYGAVDMIGTYGQVIQLAEPPADATRIIGVDLDDLLGACLLGEDLDQDGYDDAIMSAAMFRSSSGIGGVARGGADGPGNARLDSGEVYVLYGEPALRGMTLDLKTKIDREGKPLDSDLTLIYGPDYFELMGEEIAAGDVDGDGRPDLGIGALISGGISNEMENAGEAWIVYTHDPLRGEMIDLAEAAPERALVVFHDQPHALLGDTLRLADVDGDGLADLLIGAPNYDVVGADSQVRDGAGLLAILYSEDGGLPHHNGQILLFNPPEEARLQVIIGTDPFDMISYALAVYDVDGDGLLDVAPNGMGGDGAHNEMEDAGEIYIISGQLLQQPE